MRAAVAAFCSASAAFAVSGFSQSTCFPASSVASVQRVWSPLGNGLYTASMSGDAIKAP